MRVLTTLYIADHRASVMTRHGSLVVSSGDGTKSRVPLEALEAVVIVGGGHITSDALAACTEHGVQVTGLSQGGRIRFEVGRSVGGNVHLRLAQVRSALDTERANEIGRWIVAGKLENARRLLQRWAWDAHGSDRRFLRRIADEIADRSRAVATAVSGDAIRGFEGDGTRRYFEGLSRHLESSRCGFRFDTRSRRPPRDPVNAALSFVYGIVLTGLTGAVEAVGLDPQVGFLHGIRPGRPSLALDLLEEFRVALADRFVVGAFSRRMLADEDFVHTLGGACYLSEAGRRRLLLGWDDFKRSATQHPLLEKSVDRGSLLVVQATMMARFLRGDLPAYPPYVMVG